MSEMVTLGDVCEIIMGQSPPSSSYNEIGDGLPFYQGKADFGDVSPTVRIYCNEPKKIAHKDNILMSVRAPVGAVNISSETCCIGRGLAAFSPIKEKLNNLYLYYYFLANEKKIADLGTGSTFKAISKDTIHLLTIRVPPLLKQEHIVSVLDTAALLIESRKKQIALLDEAEKSLFVEMFGDPTINPFNWKLECLEKHVQIIGGFAFKSCMYDSFGIPLLRIGNINQGIFQPINLVYIKEDPIFEKFLLFPGDLVISLTGTVGKDDYGNVCILDSSFNKYYLNQRNAKLDINNQSLNSKYLSATLKFKDIKRKLTKLSRGIRQANISNKDILELKIPIPPLSLQQQFASRIESIESCRRELEAGLAKMEEARAALMQEYFG